MEVGFIHLFVIIVYLFFDFKFSSFASFRKSFLHFFSYYHLSVL